MLLLKLVSVGVKPEGSEALPLGPKNHSKVGAGILESGKEGFLGLRVAEQVSEQVSPAVVESGEDMATER